MKNPKTLAGIAVLAVLAVLGGLLAARLIPVVREVRREMSLTPTPLPPAPASVNLVTRDPSAPTPEPALRTGSKGQAVTDLQSRLKTLGYYSGEIDGRFGSGTKDAVIAFQKRNGLDADGIAGTETRSLLFSAEARPNAPGGTEAAEGTPSPE